MSDVPPLLYLYLLIANLRDFPRFLSALKVHVPALGTALSSLIITIMRPYILRQNPTKTEDSWIFEVPEQVLRPPRTITADVITGKLVIFNKDSISLTMQRLPSNRVLRADDPSKFILVSFGGFRLPDTTLRESSEYILRFLTKGLFLNGVQYHFYHHSNSQLVRTSFLNSKGHADV